MARVQDGRILDTLSREEMHDALGRAERGDQGRAGAARLGWPAAVTPFAALAVFAGAGFGALLRWVLGLRLNGIFPTLPLGTLAANLIGGLLIGLAVAWLARHPGLPPELRLFVVTGFLGGLTTFSTFSAEVVTLLTRGDYLWGLATAAVHLAGSLILTGLGMGLAQVLATRH